MPLAWRLCRAPYSDLSGTGALLHGGRWNTPGRPLTYAAADPALCVLEVRVHLDLPPDLIPDDYVLTTIDLADLAIEDIPTFPENPQSIGDTWLRNRRTPLLRVPSLIIPESPNLLLNPAHPAATAARVVTTRPFTFDPRLWLP